MDPHRLLIAVDESEATRRAIEYVATVAGGSLRGIVLFHVLPPLPPELLEHGGVADEEARADLSREVHRLRALQRDARRDAEAGMFEWMRARLEASGVVNDAIVTATSTSVHVRDIVPELLAAAREHHCRTVVVGREQFSRLRELFQRHICDELIRSADGLAVWVVQ